MNIYYVYTYVREDGTPYYIGKGKGDRAFEKHRNGKLSVPEDKSRIIFLVEQLSEQDAFDIECLFIKLYGRKNNNTGILRNMTDGGEGTSGYILTEKDRQKISNTHKGKIVSEETRQKISNSKKGMPGRVQSIEEIQKKSERLKGRPSIHKGRKLSPEIRQKMSNSKKGKKRGPYNKKPRQSTIAAPQYLYLQVVHELKYTLLQVQI
jgi:hypothetical protein